MIEVVESGLSTTVQDLGRYGHYHIGMPPSGAMDQFAHRVANYLVGNEPAAATLEMTYVGGTLRFEEEAVVAVTGADMSPAVNEESVPSWSAIGVGPGDELSLDIASEGVRSYVAVSGGVDVPRVLGSQSTYTLIGIGGKEGRTLEDGDVLETEDGADPSDVVGSSVDDNSIPNYGNQNRIRVVMGLCDYRLTDEGRENFLAADWKVSDEADRVGYRFEGPDIQSMFIEREQPFGAGTDITNVVDVGYPVGSIQMAGQPIILMQDAVTGGGYATVGTVISPDRGRLAQRRTHTTVNFEAVTIRDALAARENHQRQLETIRDSVSA